MAIRFSAGHDWISHSVAAIAVFASATLALSDAAAFSGCNSGNVATSDLLSSANCQASASFAGATAVGNGANVSGLSGTAFGEGAKAAEDGATLGNGAGGVTPATGATSIGFLSNGAGLSATAVGKSAVASGSYATAVGGGDNTIQGADGFGDFTVAIGSGALARGERSVALGAFAGDNADASNNRNTALGEESGRFVTGGGNTGAGLAAGHTVTGDLNTGVGNSAGQQVTGSSNVAGGVSSGRFVDGSHNAAYGDSAGDNVTGNGNIAIGQKAGSHIHANNTIAIGHKAQATKTDSIAIGASSSATAAHTVSFGSAGNERRLVNVANGKANTDAATLGQVKALIRSGGKSDADDADTSELRASGNVTLASAVTGRRPAGASSPAQNGVSSAQSGGCKEGDIAGQQWSLFASGGDDAIACEVQFVKGGAAKYSVAGHCQAHGSDASARAYRLEGRDSISLSNACKLSGSFTIRRGNSAITATILDARVEGVGEIKTRAAGISRWPKNKAFALQTLVMQR